MIEADDKFNAGEAVQQASRLVEREKVQIVTGIATSNVLMAAVKPLISKGALVISANAGPSPLAGAGCQPNLFVTSFQNDQWSTGIGKYLSENNFKRVYFLGMNFQAGWDHTKAAIRNFSGEKVAEVYTPTSQLDFSAEISQIRAAKPDAVYAFYVAGPAVAFVKQYAQAGLDIPLISMAGIADPTLFKAEGDAAVGVRMGTNWSASFDNPANKKFVAAFSKKYDRIPSFYAAEAYDTIMLLDVAIKDAGTSTDMDKLRASLRKVKFDSVRGKWRFNTNQFPVQDIFMEQVVKGADGKLDMKFMGIAAKDVGDIYANDCKMTN
jgi:branched-chain amino acid transport system substrate-binding protein